ncbi:hypothetical protein VV01_00455 [Luteipulveratus halotolerans]|uniref:Uncharacterized protein n=2 Tax=Luteipulveratus halotolerans TaxID=1631356 RepID=A0A0L6CEQ7_9MICO|nr:hypothetical protein VV01_00455 [Luteipulveratus halotolerans]
MHEQSRSWRTRHARRLRRVIAIFCAIALAAVVGPSLAIASHYEASLEGSSFQIDNDANFRVDPDPDATLDWMNVTEQRSVDKPTGQTDDSYSGGTKEDTSCPSSTTGSIPNNKSDLRVFGVYVEPGKPGYLNMYWTRVSDPSGTTLMDFEFNHSKTPCGTGPNVVRTVGDLLVEYSIDQGGARAVVTVRRWTGSAWGPATTLDPTKAAGTINTSVIPAAQADGTIPAGSSLAARTFGEAQIDLSAIFNANKCESFGSAMLKSRSSDSFTSQLKDYIAPVPINLSNCGNVVIHKDTVPDESDADFGYTKSFGTDPATASTFTLNDKTKDTITFDNVLLGSGYTVKEDTLPSGWDFDKIDCSASTGVTPSVSGQQITFDIDAVADVLDCTYYNKARARLTVVKQTKDQAGAFDFTSTGGLDPGSFTLTTTGVGQAGQAQRSFEDLAPGTYGLTEADTPNWNLASATCDDGSDPASISLSAGDDVTCTFVNERERGAIDITKTRKHAAAQGGVAPHPGVQFTVSGGGLADPVVVTTDSAGKACVPGLLDGSYTVTEKVPAGYVNADATKQVAVTDEATCGGSGTPAAVAFTNTPLTDVTVSVDSQVEGGTASTISCVDGDGNVVVENTTNQPGDVSVAAKNLPPTAPKTTLVCTIVVDP